MVLPFFAEAGSLSARLDFRIGFETLMTASFYEWILDSVLHGISILPVACYFSAA